jgi:hypothetical protein
LADKEERRIEDHIFVKPEVTSYQKKTGAGRPYPPSEVEHEENEYIINRRKQGIRSWLKEIVAETKDKPLRDEMVYFVIDFEIEVNHPQILNVLKKLQTQVLSVLDEKKTKVLVASELATLERIANSIELSASAKKIIFDVRPIKRAEQIDDKLFSDKTWLKKPKNTDIFVIPNIPTDKIETYVRQAKNYLIEKNVDVLDTLVDERSKLGMLSARIDFQTTDNLLKTASFIYKVYETPSINIASVNYRPTNQSHPHSKNADPSLSSSGRMIALANLPVVCVVDTGVNTITQLQNLIAIRSAEPCFQNDNDDKDDHGTPIAYLAAYGETRSHQARIISHKIKSGPKNSNLLSAIGRAISSYLHKTRIFTCSIRFDYNDAAAIFETGKIDQLVQASNACVLFSAGNIEQNELQSIISGGSVFPTWLENKPVALPSDSVSVISIGAYSQKSKPDSSIAPADSPAPFTRCKTNNTAMCNCIKPEVVEHGGNLNHDLECCGLGVKTFSSSGSAVEKIGTSFSTPIVAGHLAQLVHKYGSLIRNAETLKAIMYSSCEPTHSYPKFTGFGRPNCREMLYSTRQSAKIVFEGEMRLVNPYFQKSDPANKISVYVPVGVEKIELTVVHTDDYSYSPVPGLHTYIEVVPDKPARESPSPPDRGNLSGKAHVKKLMWSRTKGVKGTWTFTLIPRQIGIPYALRENITIRYGGVVKLSTNRQRSTSLASEVRRNLKETIIH